MSVKTWKKEFYPISAKSPKTKLGAIKHSIKKWRGLTIENLKKHDVETSKYFSCIRDPKEVFIIDAGSCALCNLYLYPNNDMERKCLECPLYSILNKKSCDVGMRSPYAIWADKKNPNPMIHALETALQNEIKTSR